MHKIVALALALIPFHAEAKNPVPEGGYMLIDPILSAGVKMGMIVPIYTHMTSVGDTLRFTFITSFTPDKQTCETTKKCKRSVEALTLTVSENEGRIVIEDSAVNTDEPIDRADVDTVYIIAPTQIFADDAVLVVAGDDAEMPGVITLIKRGGRAVRLAPATLEFTESTIDFAKQYELALSGFDHCVVGQLAEFNALRDRTAAQEDILRVARFARRVDKLGAVWDYTAPPPEKGSAEWMNKRVLAILRLAQTMGDEGDSSDPADRVQTVIEGTPLPKAFGDDFQAIYDEAVAGHEEDILAARSYTRSVSAAMDRHGRDAMKDRLCESVILESP